MPKNNYIPPPAYIAEGKQEKYEAFKVSLSLLL